MSIRNTCRQCHLIPRRSYSTLNHESVQSSYLSHPAVPNLQAKLSTRSLIALHGVDVSHFLQGITTNNISTSQTHGFYSAFLTAQGRVLHDVFIYPAAHSPSYISTLPTKLDARDPAYIIEVDSNERSNLIRHIKKYKLRAKFDVRPLTPGEWDVFSLWNGDAGWSPGLGTDHRQSYSGDIGCLDSRAPGMGYRSIKSGISPVTPGTEQILTISGNEYKVRRILKGLPEGQLEILKEAALPAESNIDYMGGIDFRKGCYVGQELTIRTHHTGVVRKRILPVQLYSSDEGSTPAKLSFEEGKVGRLPPNGSDISKVGVEKKGRSAGKWLEGVGNVGLALCRLETMTDTVLTGGTGQWSPTQEFRIQLDGAGPQDGGEVRVKAFIPAWHKVRGVLGEKT